MEMRTDKNFFLPHQHRHLIARLPGNSACLPVTPNARNPPDHSLRKHWCLVADCMLCLLYTSRFGWNDCCPNALIGSGIGMKTSLKQERLWLNAFLSVRHCYISSHEELCEVEQADDNQIADAHALPLPHFAIKSSRLSSPHLNNVMMLWDKVWASSCFQMSG